MSEPGPVWVPTVASLLGALRAQLSKADSEQVELAVHGTPTDCFVGIDRDGFTWLRIACDPATVTTDDLTAAVRFDLRNNGYRVRIAATAVETVAIHFLDEIVQVLKEGHSPGDAGRTVLQNWRDLLARPAGEPLSDAALVGLFGELEVLETTLRNGGNIGHWTGWDKDHNDFRFPGLAIEVKSTTSPNYRRVQIHGLRQLADPEDGSQLILVLRRLEQSPSGRSIPDLIDEIVRLGAPRAVVLNHLTRAHYFEHHRAHYELRRFVSHQLAIRRIDESHPRLIPSMLREVDLSHIDRVNYELNLNDDQASDLETTLEELIPQYLEAV